MKTTYAIYLGIFPAELRACEKIKNPPQRRRGAETTGGSPRGTTQRKALLLKFSANPLRLRASAVGFQEYFHRH